MPVDLLALTTDPAGYVVREQIDQGLPWDKAKFNLGRYGIEPPDSARKDYELGLARRNYEGQTPYSGDTYAERFARRLGQWLPWVSSGLELGHSIQYQSAKERFAAGQATKDDLDRIAAHERTKEWRAQQTTGEAVADTLVRIPGMAAEFTTGAAALRGLGFAPRTTALGKVGQSVLSTPLVPSMYLPGAAAQAEKSGGSPLDPSNMAPAVAYGAAQMAVLGHLGGRLPGLAPTVVGRLGARTAAGMGQQQAVDVGATAFDRAAQSVIGRSLGLDTGYGTAGSFLRGDDDAAKHAIVQAVTFAAFSAMHLPEDAAARRQTPRKGRVEPPKPAAPHPVVKAAADVLKEQASAGAPESEAARRLRAISDRFERLLREDPATAWETARDLWKEEREFLSPAEQTYAREVGKAVSEVKRAELDRAQRPGIERYDYEGLPEPPGVDYEGPLRTKPRDAIGRYERPDLRNNPDLESMFGDLEGDRAARRPDAPTGDPRNNPAADELFGPDSPGAGLTAPKRLDSRPAENANKPPETADPTPEAQPPARAPENATTAKPDALAGVVERSGLGEHLDPEAADGIPGLFPADATAGKAVLNLGRNFVTLVERPERGSVEVGFRPKGVTPEAQTGQRARMPSADVMGLLKQVRQVAEAVVADGKAVEYEVADVTEGRSARHSLYSRVLSSLGLSGEKVSEAPGQGGQPGRERWVWRPAAEPKPVEPKRLDQSPDPQEGWTEAGKKLYAGLEATEAEIKGLRADLARRPVRVQPPAPAKAPEPAPQAAPPPAPSKRQARLARLRAEGKSRLDPLRELAAAEGRTPSPDEIYRAAGLQEAEVAFLADRIFGKDGGPKTLQEMGDAAGVTRERVRQIEEDILAKLDYEGSMEDLIRQVAEANREGLRKGDQVTVSGKGVEGEVSAAGRPSKSQAREDAIEREMKALADRMSAEMEALGVNELPPERKDHYAKEYEKLVDQYEGVRGGGEGPPAEPPGRRGARVRPAEAGGEASGGTRPAGGGAGPVGPARGPEPGAAPPAGEAPAGPVDLFGNKTPRPVRAAKAKEAADEGLVNKETEVEPGVEFGGFPLKVEMLDGLLRGGRGVGGLLRKWMTSAGDLPAEVFREKVAKDGLVNAYGRDVVDAVRDLHKAIGGGRAYARLTDQQVLTLNDALAGDQAALMRLPPESRGPIERMRQIMDGLTDRLIHEGALQGDLALVADANKGFYLHRSYRVFRDPNWAQKVDPAIRNFFKAWLAKERAAAGLPSDPDSVEAMTRLLLTDGTAADNPIAFLSGGKLGAKDLSILTRRKDVPLPLRQLWGEVTDPVVNFTNSVHKMSSLLANHLFLTHTRARGLGRFLFEEKGIGDFQRLFPDQSPVRIAAKGNKALAPLDGLVTTKEIKDAFEDIYSTKGFPVYVRAYLGALGLAKMSKTVLSHVSTIRNFVGNVGFAVQNGHWNAGKLAHAIKANVSDTPAGRSYWRRLVELGVVGESVHAGEFRSIADDVFGAREAEKGLAPGMLSDKLLLRLAGKGLDAAQRLYGAMDAVWKVYAYEHELARYGEARPGLSKAELEQRAADIVRDTYPTYSLTPRAVKGVRRLPFVGPFVSFPSEVVRTTYKSVRLGIEEMKDPRTRAIGAKRLVGNVVAMSLAPALAATSRAIFGLTRDDEEAMRRFMPEWSRNSWVVHVGSDDHGNRRYLDLGYTDPHSYLHSWLLAVMRGEDPKDVALTVARPFVEEELLTRRALDVARQPEQGRPVYSPQDTTLEKLQKGGGHVGGAFVPGSVDSLRQLRRALAGEVNPKTGQPYDLASEAGTNAAGQRINTVDVRRSLSFRAKAFEAAKRESQQKLTQMAGRYDMVSDDDIRAARASSEEARRKVYDELRADVLAAERLGLSRAEVSKALREAGVTDEDVRAVTTGKYLSWTPDELRGPTPQEGRRRLRVALGR